MAAYLVLKECAYINAAGAAVHHQEVEGGLVADIPADVASGLGDAVRPMVSGDSPDLVNPTPFPDVRKAAAKTAVAASEKTGRPVDPQVEKLAVDG